MKIFKIFEKIKKNSYESSKIEKIIVGLGNPSQKYEYTRHNAGFMAINAVAKMYSIDVNRKDVKKFNAIVGSGYITKKRCLFLKPLTYMNNSGETVEAARNFYKLNTSDILVLYDDVSFEIGTIRIRKKGSSGGHNGIKSIIENTGENDFLRIKIGVGKKPEKEYPLDKWVLSNFTAIEKEKLKETFKKVSKATELIVNEKIDEAMNMYN